MSARSLPYQHLSIRVPWHDSGWEGTVCVDPLNNGSCLRLGRIAAERKDAVEVQVAGKKWSELDEADVPPCAVERAGFMADHGRQVLKRHPYASWNDTYRKFRPTTFELPSYSADCVPFRWMLRDNAEELIDRYRVDYSADVEADVDQEAGLKNPSWIQHADNQTALLDTFFSAAKPDKSLCFIYAKESPLADDHRRVLIGVGRVKTVGNVVPYRQDGGGFGSVLWERIVQHSIRPTMEDGFLLPYQRLLELGQEGSIDPADFAVFVPEEFTNQFSYATEHVTHDAALALLLSLSSTVKRLAGLTPGNWAGVGQWLSDRISEIWQARGVSPGLGSALRAFGISEGVLVAHTIQSRLAKPDDDPWPIVNQILTSPASDPDNADRIGPSHSKMWISLPEERRSLLKLLSRFDLSIDQATRFYQPTERTKASIEASDAELLANPYRIYELDRPALEPVTVNMIDRGVFPPDQIRLNQPLPEPSFVGDEFDSRRVRALLVHQLERAAVSGDTLRSQDRLIQAVRDEPLDPGCPLSVDMMSVVVGDLAPEIEIVSMADNSPALQLRRFVNARAEITKVINRRRKAAPLAVTADWSSVIDASLGDAAQDDPDEVVARAEKAAALEVLATSRVSVLIGAAGTGKTTLLKALCGLPGIEELGFLLLAPTGKARVRMQTAIGRSAETVAQLLVKVGRFDPDTGRYHRSDHNRRSGFGTVIIDECSMLTEDQLDAVLDGIDGYSRLILVGDPRQLPPIGAGRPFVDITNHLRSEADISGTTRVGQSYAELTVRRRQVAEGSKNTERPDLVLAEWFSGEDPSPGADEVWDALGRNEDLGTIRIREWKTPGDLQTLICTELADELSEMSDVEDANGFQESYGGNATGEHVYFNRGAAAKAENWQILSPIRGEGGGVNEINRMLHRKYRASHLELAATSEPWKRRIPPPAGPEEVIYGDKVINVRNKKRASYYPKNDDVIEYVANGEIGVVVGPFRPTGKQVPLNRLNVEFSTQQGVAYDFWMNELGSDDGNPFLELAYAITIHKSQGSEFGTTFVVIPNPCRLLSRELLYTALTRQQHRVVVLHQGQLSDMRQYADAAYSEAAARTTNLFVAPAPVEVNGKFLEKGLIHQTRKGTLVRSKSEVIVADLLYSKNIDFQYEQTLNVSDGTSRLPDFTIVDDMAGKTYYWEHLGMLSRPSYRAKWEVKREWYRSHGILHHDEGGGLSGTLLTTEDGEDGSISSAEIEAMIDEVLS